MTTTNTDTESMAAIRAKAKVFADRRKVLLERVRNLVQEKLAIYNKLIGGIESATADVAEAEDALKREILEHRDAFAPPAARSVVYHGVKVGMRTPGPTVEYEDEQKLIEQIEALFGDRAEEFRKVEKSIKKKALKDMADEDLEALGLSRVEPEDEVLIKAQGDEVEALVKKLMEDDRETRGKRSKKGKQ